MEGKAMFTLQGSGESKKLIARFEEVHEHASTEILFQRTLRVPDDGNVYPLPAGLGLLPLRHLEDFESELPPEWADRGGVITPLYQAEAMWIGFGEGYPCAIKVGAGKINAISGKPWTETLDASERDYVVAPPQPALDGFCAAQGIVRQFVAMPLGKGFSAEEQITGKADHGGIQIVVYPMKKERYEQLRAEHAQLDDGSGLGWAGDMFALAPSPAPRAMALAAGGHMSERIISDPFGIDAWDQSARGRCFVTLIDAVRWSRVTGALPTTLPFTAENYEKAGLPWFEYYAEDLEALGGASALGGVRGVRELAEAQGLQIVDGDGATRPGEVAELRLVRPPRPSSHPRPSVRGFWGYFKLPLRRRDG